MYKIGTKITVHPKVANIRVGYYDITTGERVARYSSNSMYFHKNMRKLAGKVVTVTEVFGSNGTFSIGTSYIDTWTLIPDWVQNITFK